MKHSSLFLVLSTTLAQPACVTALPNAGTFSVAEARPTEAFPVPMSLSSETPLSSEVVRRSSVPMATKSLAKSKIRAEGVFRGVPFSIACRALTVSGNADSEAWFSEMMPGSPGKPEPLVYFRCRDPKSGHDVRLAIPDPQVRSYVPGTNPSGGRIVVSLGQASVATDTQKSNAAIQIVEHDSRLRKIRGTFSASWEASEGKNGDFVTGSFDATGLLEP